MGTLRTVLDGVMSGCVIVFGVTWMAGAIYFGLKEPGGARAIMRGFGRSWLSRIGLAAVIVAIAALTGRHWTGFWTHLQYWNPVLAAIGALVAVAATALLVWARLVLGGMWASVPLVQDEHRLVTRGPYARVRHPIYTGLLGLALGAALTYGFGVWLAVLVLAVPFVLRRVYVEDGMMARTFGAEYDAYRARVPALFPSISAARPSSTRRSPN